MNLRLIRAMMVVIGPAILLNLTLVAATITLIAQTLASRRRPGITLRHQLLLWSLALLPWLYLIAIRPWHRRWGATDFEWRGQLPGDELVPEPAWHSTRAVTINAPMSTVWPWLTQLGQDRGGLYTYDWLENIAGLDFQSADRILPDSAHLQIGDLVRAVPESLAAEVGWNVTSLEPNRALVLSQASAFSWSFVLEPQEDRKTRLIVRSRLAGTPRILSMIAFTLLVEVQHFIMERGMLLGIKERAERLVGHRPARRPLIHRMRPVNKRLLNPLMLKFAGRRWMPVAVLHHLGRRTGRPHTTPVLAAIRGDRIVIPLPYSREVDWRKNLLASGRGSLQYGGKDFLISDPQPLELSAARSAFWPPFWHGLRLLRTKHFLTVKQAPLQDTGSDSNASAPRSDSTNDAPPSFSTSA